MKKTMTSNYPTEVKEAFDYILDTMSGSDGGVRFAKFMNGLNMVCADNNPAARELERVVIRFARLIDQLQKI